MANEKKTAWQGFREAWSNAGGITGIARKAGQVLIGQTLQTTALSPVGRNGGNMTPEQTRQTFVTLGRGREELYMKLRMDRAKAELSQLGNQLGSLAKELAGKYIAPVISLGFLKNVTYGDRQITKSRNGVTLTPEQKRESMIRRKFPDQSSYQKLLSNTRRFANRMKVKGSPEHSAMEALTLQNATGELTSEFGDGWTGVIRSIRMLPVPEKYGNSVLAGYTIAENGRAYIAPSIGQCFDDENMTLEFMLNRAMDLKLRIPDRPDGKPWERGMRITDDKDRNIFMKCLARMPKSPFIAPKSLVEGTDILIKDINCIIDAEISNKNLSPSNISRHILDYKNEWERKLKQALKRASTPEKKQAARLELAKLEELQPSYMKHFVAEAEKHKVHDQRRGYYNDFAVVPNNPQQSDRDVEAIYSEKENTYNRMDLTGIKNDLNQGFVTLKQAMARGLKLDSTNTEFVLQGDGDITACVNLSDNQKKEFKIQGIVQQECISPDDVESGKYNLVDPSGDFVGVMEVGNVGMKPKVRVANNEIAGLITTNKVEVNTLEKIAEKEAKKKKFIADQAAQLPWKFAQDAQNAMAMGL